MQGAERKDDVPEFGETGGQSYSRIVWLQFRRNQPAVAVLAAVGILAVVAIAADLIAGNKPYYMEYRGKTYFPALRQYGVHLGLTDWPKELRRRKNFKRL